ncbi:hypothetical protein [Nonomuraea sp. NPDC050643]|uniref:hypothetical protein n=1 Tax=Nonomuraea sp. NPDC050643 TaxID=3155660 RepID=UPI0034026A35
MWELWSIGPDVGWWIYCPAALFPQPVTSDQYVLPLRADTRAMLSLTLHWAVPALVVLMAWIRSRSAVMGRRVAAILTLYAVLEPLTRTYFTPGACGEARVFSGPWFAEAGARFGTNTSMLLLLTAAVLVLVAGQMTGPAEEPPPASAGVVARRVAAFLIGYWAVVVSLVAGGAMSMDELDMGLLAWLTLSLFPSGPLPPMSFTVVPALVLLALSLPGACRTLPRRLRTPR